MGLMPFAGWAPAQATIVGFDSGITEGYDGEGFVPNGYAGLNWNSFVAVNATPYVAAYGYMNGITYGVVSAPAVAIGVTSSSSFSSSAAFSLVNLYMTAVWNNGLNVNIDGYLNGNLVDNYVATLDGTAPLLITLDWGDVDNVVFTPSGGTNAGFGNSGVQFAIDNVTIGTPFDAPEPLTLSIFSAGFGGIAFIRRKRKNAA